MLGCAGVPGWSAAPTDITPWFSTHSQEAAELKSESTLVTLRQLAIGLEGPARGVAPTPQIVLHSKRVRMCGHSGAWHSHTTQSCHEPSVWHNSNSDTNGSPGAGRCTRVQATCLICGWPPCPRASAEMTITLVDSAGCELTLPEATQGTDTPFSGPVALGLRGLELPPTSPLVGGLRQEGEGKKGTTDCHPCPELSPPAGFAFALLSPLGNFREHPRQDVLPYSDLRASLPALREWPMCQLASVNVHCGLWAWLH